MTGLLSDDGLYELSSSVRNEWRHLATVLHVSAQRQTELVEGQPRDADARVYEMLRSWRDGYTGSKAQVRAALSDAFVVVERPDIAERLVQEEMIGSAETLDSAVKVVSVV